MSKFYLDAGTTWSKIIEIESSGKISHKILPSSEVKKLNLSFEGTTGHSANVKSAKYVNEIVALARGSQKQIRGDGIVLDLGSRDIKWVKFKEGKFQDMDWNTSCASAVGATVEMLLKFYNCSLNDLTVVDEKYVITCGIFGLEKIMDEVSGGLKPKIAISKFVHGLAFNAYNFAKCPEELYISGGFCENKCFVESLNKYTKVIPLGRFVLANGLIED